MVNRFVREIAVPKGRLRPPIAVPRFMNMRIMLPATPNLFFPYHTGLLYGHGVASRSLWPPFVDVTADEDRSRSMQIIGIKRSRELIKIAIDKRLGMEEMTELFGKKSHQIKAKPGSSRFFSQENIHGSGRAEHNRQDAGQHGFPARRGHLWRSARAENPGRLFPPDP